MNRDLVGMPVTADNILKHFSFKLKVFYFIIMAKHFNVGFPEDGFSIVCKVHIIQFIYLGIT